MKENIDHSTIALSLDTNIYYEHQYNFGGGPLRQLEQLGKHPGLLIQTDIVYREAIKHITTEIKENLSKVESGIKKLAKYNKLGRAERQGILDQLLIDREPQKTASSIVDGFIERTGTTIITAKELLDPEALTDMYFSTRPPFENNAEKKNEFPDAIALICLSEWAKRNDREILVITKDKGWHRYIEGDKKLRTINSIADALELLQPTLLVQRLSREIASRHLFSPDSELYEHMIEKIIDHTSDQTPSIDADSFLNIDYQDVQVSYINHELLTDEQGNAYFKIIQIDDESATLQFEAEVATEVSADFDFSAYDSIDKDYVTIAGLSSTIETNYHVQVIVYLSILDGEEESDEMEISLEDIEIAGSIRRVNFGSLEPDFSDD